MANSDGVKSVSGNPGSGLSTLADANSTRVLIAVNVVVAAGVLFFGWDAFNVVFLFWLEKSMRSLIGMRLPEKRAGMTWLLMLRSDFISLSFNTMSTILNYVKIVFFSNFIYCIHIAHLPI